MSPQQYATLERREQFRLLAFEQIRESEEMRSGGCPLLGKG